MNKSNKSRSILDYKIKLYKYIKDNKMQYSRQLEQTLKIMFTQTQALTSQELVTLLHDEGYSHMNEDSMLEFLRIYKNMGWLKEVKDDDIRYSLAT